MFISQLLVMQMCFIYNWKTLKSMTYKFQGCWDKFLIIPHNYQNKAIGDSTNATVELVHKTPKCTTKFNLYKVESIINSHKKQKYIILNPIQDWPFQGCSRMWGVQRSPLPKIFHIYPTMMKLGTIIRFLKKTKK